MIHAKHPLLCSALLLFLLSIACEETDGSESKTQSRNEEAPPSGTEASSLQPAREDSTQAAREDSKTPRVSPSQALAPRSGTISPELTNQRTVSCAEMCKKTASLQCPGHEQCSQICMGSFNIPICVEEMGAFLTCSLKTPVSAFTCDLEDGGAVLKDGFCKREQIQVMSCISESLSAH